MKLTIKNYNNCIGWAFHGPENNLTWKIKSVTENDSAYAFMVTLFDDLDNAIKADTIILSREPRIDADGDITYLFLPHRRHSVTPAWFTIGNAYTAFESEIKRLNENY